MFHKIIYFDIYFCMTNSNKTKFFIILKRICIAIVSIAMIICLPMANIANAETQIIYEKFVGKKSDFQGIIEIWNIDTFESGTVSKADILKTLCERFQNKNKGVFVLVKSMTLQECLNELNLGNIPDLFSCSYGVAERIKDYIQPFDESFCGIVQKEFENAGKIGDELFAFAWCRGNYYLITTKDKLQKAKVENIDDFNLIENALNLGFETQLKNKTKTTFSLTFGAGEFGMPQMVLKTYNITGESSKKSFSINTDKCGQTGFLAYSSFVVGESVALLGTQRDVVRMQNRIKNQKESDVIFEPISKFNDLIQFMLLTDKGNQKNGVVQKLVKFLAEKESQNLITKTSMFPIIKMEIGEYENGVMRDILPEIISDCIVPNLFLTKSQIDEFRKF